MAFSLPFLLTVTDSLVAGFTNSCWILQRNWLHEYELINTVGGPSDHALEKYDGSRWSGTQSFWNGLSDHALIEIVFLSENHRTMKKSYDQVKIFYMIKNAVLPSPLLVHETIWGQLNFMPCLICDSLIFIFCSFW